MSAIILASMIALPVMWPAPADILETSSIYSWTCSELLGWQSRMMRDGTPLLIWGHEPFPGWGSFESVTIRSPLEAGLWGNGKWEIDFESSEVPDSSYASGIGLLENTSYQNRYSAYLRRPLPADLFIDFSLSREDTLKNQRFVLGRDNIVLAGRGWQTTEDGYTLWSSWKPANFMTRLSFVHLNAGGRQWELLGSYSAHFGAVLFQTGAAGSLSDSEMQMVEGHMRLEFPFQGMTTVLRADISDSQDEFSLGGTAGLIASYGFLDVQAGAVLPPGSDISFIGIAEAGPAELNLRIDSDGIEGGLQTIFTTGFVYLHSGVSLKTDTLRFAGTVMPSLEWGASGRIHGGVTWDLLNAHDHNSGTMDLKSLFTLGNFAFIFAVEDILDDYRSYTFGITWIFNDRPPRIAGEEEDGN
ncbi:MAG: hypothetical protein KAW14_01225 [Candidatus Aegiribacteria sp.]|nr:hypothetical protein [Candidatus Aegiribacteria sp.]